MSHPENPDWLNKVTDEIASIDTGLIRCNTCNQRVKINSRFLDILISRGIDSIDKCSQCANKK